MNQNTENGYTLKRDNTNRLHYHIHTEPKKNFGVCQILWISTEEYGGSGPAHRRLGLFTALTSRSHFPHR